QLAAADPRRLADQDQERSLEGVLHVVRAAEQSPANAEDHRPVPAHQGFKSRLVAPRQESFEQLAVLGLLVVAEGGPAQVPDDAADGTGRHAGGSVRTGLSPLLYRD